MERSTKIFGLPNRENLTFYVAQLMKQFTKNNLHYSNFSTLRMDVALVIKFL